MPKNKDLKRLVRARMRRTGEAYTTARARLLEKTGSTGDDELTLAAVAGYSDEIVKERTGFSWERWVEFLDAKDAVSLPHGEIARLAAAGSPKMSGWWAQAVTTGYERIKGLREVGQRRSGAYEANRSKTFKVPVTRLYRAFSQVRTRDRWLPDAEWQVRTAKTDRSMRIDWQNGTRIQFYFSNQGAAKSRVAVQHQNLASRADRDRSKEYWGERLAALAVLLQPRSG